MEQRVVLSADRILAAPGAPSIATAAGEARRTAIGAGYQQAIAQSSLAQEIAARDVPFAWGEVTLFVDDPSKGLGLADDDQIVVEKLVEVAEQTTTSLDLVSAYFIPGPRGAELLERLARDGVRTRVLTNSLEATDVMPVHAAYMGYREDLVSAGVELLELRAMREEHLDRSLPELLAGSASGLHAKVFGFDGARAFIGSYNLDPRSARLNTEMGLLIESPAIAETLAERLDDTSYAYQVEAGEDGDLIWRETREDAPARIYKADPNTTWVQRGLARVVGWLPVEWML